MIDPISEEILTGTFHALREQIAALESERDRYLKALLEIKNGRWPQVCAEFEICTHEGCHASYAAFAIADQALNPEEETAAKVDPKNAPEWLRVDKAE